jgi:hypothetical protein
VAGDFATRLSEPLRGVVREVVRKVARPLLPASKYLKQPLATWPPIVGMVREVRLPRRTLAHPCPRPTGAANINILLAMIDRTISIAGEVAECGVFRGATLVPMAVHLKQRGSGKRLLGFDSFEGFDNSILLDIGMDAPDEPSKRVGAFGNTSSSAVLAKLRRFRADNVTLIPGYFQGHYARIIDFHLSISIWGFTRLTRNAWSFSIRG